MTDHFYKKKEKKRKKKVMTKGKCSGVKIQTCFTNGVPRMDQ
jgi:hypothetical protein